MLDNTNKNSLSSQFSYFFENLCETCFENSITVFAIGLFNEFQNYIFIADVKNLLPIY